MLTEEQRADIHREVQSRILELRQPPISSSLVRIIARAVEVLGTSEKALRWLSAPIPILGKQTPVSLLETPEGIVRVEDALGQIERGIW